jgi:hypothetical protein
MNNPYCIQTRRILWQKNLANQLVKQLADLAKLLLEKQKLADAEDLQLASRP